MLLNITTVPTYVLAMMKKTVSILSLIAATALANPASAECYADYKAKKPAPLQLHYGVIRVPDGMCDNRTAISNFIAQRISVGGWNLLNVMSVFGPEGLAGRRTSAGSYYLKF
jgi:hypothetical protein